MNCREFQERMPELFDLNPDPKTQSLLLEHLESCGKCAEIYRQAMQTMNRLKPLQTVYASGEFKAHVMEAVRESEGTAESTPLRKAFSFAWWKPAAAAGIAALLLFALSLVNWQGIFRNGTVQNGQNRALALLDQAMAAEEAFFSGEGITYFTREIVVPPLSDTLLCKGRWSPLASIGANGKPVSAMLLLPAEPGQGYTLTDETWFEPGTGRFSHVVSAGEEVVYANSFDGEFVYTTEQAPEGAIKIERERITEDLELPEKPSEIFGYTPDYKAILENYQEEKATEIGQGQLEDGTPVRIIKAAGIAGPRGEVIAYSLFKIRTADNTLAEIESTIRDESYLGYRYGPWEKVTTPGVQWNLAGIDKRLAPPGSAPGISVYLDMIKPDASVSGILEEAEIPVYLFSSNPSWAGERNITNVSMPKVAGVQIKFTAIVYLAEDSRHVCLVQMSLFSKFAGQTAKQGKLVYTSPGGIKVWSTEQDKWLANVTLMSAMAVTRENPAENRTGYIFESPLGTAFVVAVNGPVSEVELHELADKLVTVEEYLGRPLVESGAAFNAMGKDRWMALFAATSLGRTGKVKEFLASGADPDRKNPRTGYTALMTACSQGMTDIAGTLVEYGADVNAQRADSTTALMLAAGGGYLETLKFLIDSGADIEATGAGGHTALFAATQNGHTEVARALLEAGAKIDRRSGGITALMAAAANGQAEIVKLLVQAGADPDERRVNGQTALIMAVQSNRMEAASELIQAGADLNIPDKDDKSALMYAAVNGNVEIIKALLEAGALLEARNANGATALMHAASAGHSKAVKAFIAAGADINAENNEGQTALQLASSEGHAETVNLLKQAGAVD